MSHGPNQPHPAMRRRSAVRQASSKSQGFFNCGESGAGSTERHARQFCIASLASTESVHRRSVALTWHNLSSLEALDLLARPRLQGGLLEAISKVSMARTRASGPALQIKKKVPSRLKASHQLIAQILAFSRVSAKHSAHVFKPAGPYQSLAATVFSLFPRMFFAWYLYGRIRALRTMLASCIFRPIGAIYASSQSLSVGRLCFVTLASNYHGHTSGNR